MRLDPPPAAAADAVLDGIAAELRSHGCRDVRAAGGRLEFRGPEWGEHLPFAERNASRIERGFVTVAANRADAELELWFPATWYMWSASIAVGVAVIPLWYVNAGLLALPCIAVGMSMAVRHSVVDWVQAGARKA